MNPTGNTELDGGTLYLVCTRCQRRTAIASGATAHQLALSEDRSEVVASAAKLRWTVNPTVCDKCQGLEPINVNQRKDQG